jgi:hypothetical protein
MSEEERARAPIPSRSVRLQEFLARLERHRLFTSFDEAYQGLVAILEAVEDELTGIPNCPSNWMVDGRLYPPQQDHWYPVSPSITRMRTRDHYVFVARNGAVEIQEVTSKLVVLSKAGADGRKVWENE